MRVIKLPLGYWKNGRMVVPILSTDRLILRPWDSQQDAPGAFAIYGDPQVACWIGDGQALPTVAAVAQRLERDRQRFGERNAMGSWAVVDRRSQEILGNVLLVPLPDAQGQRQGSEMEIGWHFRRSHWGQGYAQEAAQAAIDHGFWGWGLPCIQAVILPSNRRSLNLAQSLGFQFRGITSAYYDRELCLFERRRGDRL